MRTNCALEEDATDHRQLCRFGAHEETIAVQIHPCFFSKSSMFCVALAFVDIDGMFRHRNAVPCALQGRHKWCFVQSWTLRAGGWVHGGGTCPISGLHSKHSCLCLPSSAWSKQTGKNCAEGASNWVSCFACSLECSSKQSILSIQNRSKNRSTIYGGEKKGIFPRLWRQSQQMPTPVPNFLGAGGWCIGTPLPWAMPEEGTMQKPYEGGQYRMGSISPGKNFRKTPNWAQVEG